MSTSLKSFTAKLESIGGSLDRGDYTHHADAPLGYVWSANGATSLTIHYASNSQTWLKEALSDAESRAKLGLRKCTPEETTEINHLHARGEEGEEPSWQAPAESPERIAWPK